MEHPPVTLRMNVLHLVLVIISIVIILLTATEDATDDPDDVGNDEADYPCSHHCYSCYPYRLGGYNEEDAEGCLGKAKEDDKEPIDPVEPLPADPIFGLIPSFLNVRTARRRRKRRNIKVE